MKVEGHFMTLERANEAMGRLKAVGFTNCHIEIDDNNRNIKRNLADTNSPYGLSNLVIDSSEMRRAPLTAISPIINVTAGFSEFNDNHYKVVVETDQSLTQNVKEVITSLGGKFSNVIVSNGRVKEDIGELNRNFKKNNI